MRKFFVKLGKRYLKKWAMSELIPKLKKEVDAGAIDEHVDNVIEKVILEEIDKI